MSTSFPSPQRHAPAGPAGSGDGNGLFRVGLHLLLAALPLLAISAHVFGLVRMQLSAAILVIPLATAVIALSVFAPHAGDRVLLKGMVWGIVGCAIYDVFRLDTVYMLGWWGDFIPTMGTWITGNPDDLVSGAVVGYIWRYIGDGGGIGITFFALASAVGLHRRPRGTVVAAAVGFAVFPVWAGLMGTVALASDGQTMMFPLTPTTVTLSLIGHLIFGLIMGLGFWHSRAVQEHWPWEPVTGEQIAARRPTGGFALPAAGADAPEAHPYAYAPALPAPSGPPSISGPLPAARAAEPHPGPLPGWTGEPASGPVPAWAADPSSGPVPAGPRSGPVPAGPSGPMPVGPRSGAVPAQAASGRAASRPAPEEGSMGPETWELWQRQLQTTVRGRRTHRSTRTRTR